ncbi:MAG: helix-turn-helix domain-containing protein [Planctomycetes bacterium]|nr:helix-turn-helix domain-containing protein [Planctomycetota bacterium]
MSEPDAEVNLDQPLTPEQIEALALLAAGLSQKEIAARLQIREETICRWKNRPAFAEEHRRLIEGIKVESRERIHVLAREAIDALKKLLVDEDPRVRLEAAKTVLQGARILGPATQVKVEIDAHDALRSMSSEDLRRAVEQLALQRTGSRIQGTP